MKIYTRRGDTGQTSLFGGQSVSKSDLRVEAYGSVDELNSQIGWAVTLVQNPSLCKEIQEIQSDLFVIGFDLATPLNSAATSSRVRRIHEDRVQWMEQLIDRLDLDLPELTRFILPGGSPEAAAFHICRTVCRRAERQIVKLSREDTINPTVLVYLNRLSDLLFVLSRWLNAQQHIPDILWESGRL